MLFCARGEAGYDGDNCARAAGSCIGILYMSAEFIEVREADTSLKHWTLNPKPYTLEPQRHPKPSTRFIWQPSAGTPRSARRTQDVRSSGVGDRCALFEYSSTYQSGATPIRPLLGLALPVPTRKQHPLHLA